MDKLTASDLVKAIAQLGTSRPYKYVSGLSQLRITNITLPEGPIGFVNVDEDGIAGQGRSVPVPSLMKMASLCSGKPNYPFHVDRVFSAGGNTRSALETLLAHTPHFFMCLPKRVNAYGDIIQNLKHIMWCPDDSHPIGEIAWKPYDDVISEVEFGTDYGRIEISQKHLEDEFDSIEARTTHVQMQIALIEIGRALDFDTWIARNDRGILVGDKKLGEFDGVISSLDDVKIFFDADIKAAAALIDCIWFTKDGKRIPAIIEIEHTTGVTSGLTRMEKLRHTIPSISTMYTIVAPDSLRSKVLQEANQRAFLDLDTRFMPYTTIRELYGLIQRYPLAGVVDHRFIYPFMEKTVMR